MRNRLSGKTASNQNSFFYATIDLPYLASYSLRDGDMVKDWEIFYKTPYYGISGGDIKYIKEKSTGPMKDIKVDDRYIYILYLDQLLSEYDYAVTEKSCANKVFVFNHKGEKVACLNLDCRLSSIAIDSKNQKMYGSVMSEEYANKIEQASNALKEKYIKLEKQGRVLPKTYADVAEQVAKDYGLEEKSVELLTTLGKQKTNRYNLEANWEERKAKYANSIDIAERIRNEIIEKHSKNIKSPRLEILGGIVFGSETINPDEEINEADFRYHGPIPFTKETAVLMMADSVEAASRSLKEKTEESISKLVDGIIDTQINDNQFINTNITFRDITTIKKVFKKKLMNIYHVRIAYPV